MAKMTLAELRKEYQKQRLSLQVRTIRTAKRMTVSELAEATGYEPSFIRKIENGTGLPDKNNVGRIAKALKVSYNQIWGNKVFSDFKDNGQPKLSEIEKTALTLLVPMMKAMSKKGQDYVLETAVMVLLAERVKADWDVYIPAKETTKK